MLNKQTHTIIYKQTTFFDKYHLSTLYNFGLQIHHCLQDKWYKMNLYVLFVNKFEKCGCSKILRCFLVLVVFLNSARSFLVKTLDYGELKIYCFS